MSELIAVIPTGSVFISWRAKPEPIAITAGYRPANMDTVSKNQGRLVKQTQVTTKVPRRRFKWGKMTKHNYTGATSCFYLWSKSFYGRNSWNYIVRTCRSDSIGERERGGCQRNTAGRMAGASWRRGTEKQYHSHLIGNEQLWAPSPRETET